MRGLLLPLFVLAACRTERLPAPLDPARSESLLPAFSFPVVERDLLLPDVMGVDHDPADYDGAEEVYCINFEGQGYPYCYDDHDGSDYDLVDGFDTMDAGSARVVAAADGVVEEAVDGNYDRCHFDLAIFDVSCDGHPVEANRVWLLHAGGWRTKYTHLQKDSVAVEVGQVVERGEVLGRIGSSGWSTAPHLHFEVRAPDWSVVDPYAGPYSQDHSYWCEQVSDDGFPGAECQ